MTGTLHQPQFGGVFSFGEDVLLEDLAQETAFKYNRQQLKYNIF